MKTQETRMIKIDLSGIKKLEAQLEKIRGLVKQTMRLKNKFTQQSIQVEKTNTLKMSDQASAVGSTQTYLETQEFGGGKKENGERGGAYPHFLRGRAIPEKTPVDEAANFQEYTQGAFLDTCLGKGNQQKTTQPDQD